MNPLQSNPMNWQILKFKPNFNLKNLNFYVEKCVYIGILEMKITYDIFGYIVSQSLAIF